MSLAKCFLFTVLLPGSISEICGQRNSLFDRSLERLLHSERFSAISLPNFSYNEENLLRLRVDFSGGKLHGFHNIRKHGQSVLNASDSGTWLTFHIEGGPFEAHYNASLQTALQRTTLDVIISVPLIQLSFTAQEFDHGTISGTLRTDGNAIYAFMLLEARVESSQRHRMSIDACDFSRSSANELRLELHDMRMARFRIVSEDTGDVRVSSVFYSMMFDELRPFIEVEIGQMLAQKFRILAVEALRGIRAYSAISTSYTERERGSAAAGDRRKAAASAHSSMAPPSGSHSSGSGGGGAYGGDGALQRPSRSGLLPPRAGLPRQRNIFEGCLKNLVQSAGLDPAPLPRDLEVFSFPTGRVTVVEGNITGLSSIRRKDDNLVKLDGCGMRARLSLAVNDLTITAAASSSSLLWGFDISVPEVEVLLGIRENNGELQIVTQELNFTAPVTVTAKLPGAVRAVANLFGGLPEITLGAEELEQLEDLFWRYMRRIVYAFQESISDVPLQPTA